MIRTVQLETAKALRAAGFLQKTDFYWQRVSNDANTVIQLMYIPEDVELKDVEPHGELNQSVTYYAAPSAEEVLEHLPVLVISDQIDNVEREYHNEMFKLGGGRYGMRYGATFTIPGIKAFIPNGGWFEDDSLAEAAAKAWLFLKKNNLLQKDVVDGFH